MILVAGYWNPERRQRGFSLLEMLIVILILGILYSLAGSMLNLSISDPLNEEQQRLRERILLAQDESLVRSRSLALGFGKKGYVFFAQGDQGQWARITQDALLGMYAFAGEYEQTVYLQGQEVVLPDMDALTPQVFILPTGEMRPFEWRLRTGSEREAMLKFDNVGREVIASAEDG